MYRRARLVLGAAVVLFGGMLAWNRLAHPSEMVLSTQRVTKLTDKQSIPKVCPGIEVQSMTVSATSRIDDVSGSGPEIKIARSAKSNENGRGQAATIIALGPILGSMDSRDLKTDLDCTAKGIGVTVDITRSANYNGAAAKNVLWRPTVELVIVLDPTVIISATWTMHLTSGAPVARAQTPPYSEQRYPVTVTAAVR